MRMKNSVNGGGCEIPAEAVDFSETQASNDYAGGKCYYGTEGPKTPNEEVSRLFGGHFCLRRMRFCVEVGSLGVGGSELKVKS
jgi:hypothetical protein